jgi:hypothetical protein
VVANAPITVASPNSGGDASRSGGSSADASAGGTAAQGGEQDVSGSSLSGQVGSAGVSPSVAAAAPVTGNTPIAILSPGSGGDATGPDDGTPPPEPDTPTAPDDTPPTGPGSESPPQGSPPGSDDDDPDTGGGGGGPAGGGPSRGREGELERNPAPSVATERRELGAPAEGLPFTGLLLWLVALIGALTLAIGTRGRQLTAA